MDTMGVCANLTLHFNTTQVVPQLPGVYTSVTGALLYFATLPLLLFHLRIVPVGSTCAVLLGCVLLVTFQIIHQEEVYVTLSHRDNLQYLCMMTAIALLAHFVNREQVVPKVLRRCLRPGQSFETYLLVVCVATFVLTALFSNDVCCLVLTPALLRLWDTQDRHKEEMDVLLLAITTSANIASITSLFGSPQMALLATRTFAKEYAASRLDLRTCIMYLLPTATVTFFLNFAFLLLYFRIRSRHAKRTKLISSASRSDQEMAGLTRENPRVYTNGSVRREPLEEEPQCGGSMRDERLITPCQLETIPEDDVLEIQTSPSLESQVRQMRYIDDTGSDASSSDSDEGIGSPPSSHDPNDNIFTVDYQPSSSQSLHRSNIININMNLHLTGSNSSLDRALKQYGLRVYRRLGVYRSLSGLSMVGLVPQDHSTECSSDPGLQSTVPRRQGSVAFTLILGVSIVAIIAALLATAIGVNLDIGLVPVAAATLVLVFDAILNGRSAAATLQSMDWSVLLLWLGVFVWTEGLATTRLPHYLWYKAGLTLSPFTSIIHLVILGAIAMVMSAIFNNVVMTLILLTQLLPCAPQLPFVLLLAWLSSAAGNLTLYSCVGNVMVAKQARLTLSHRLTFWKHLQFALPSCLLLSSLGVVIISGLLKIH